MSHIYFKALIAYVLIVISSVNLSASENANANIANFQLILWKLGYFDNQVDGKWGPASTASLIKFLRHHNKLKKKNIPLSVNNKSIGAVMEAGQACIFPEHKDKKIRSGNAEYCFQLASLQPKNAMPDVIKNSAQSMKAIHADLITCNQNFLKMPKEMHYLAIRQVLKEKRVMKDWQIIYPAFFMMSKKALHIKIGPKNKKASFCETYKKMVNKKSGSIEFLGYLGAFYEIVSPGVIPLFSKNPKISPEALKVMKQAIKK